jgi:hypothetical protein
MIGCREFMQEIDNYLEGDVAAEVRTQLEKSSFSLPDVPRSFGFHPENAEDRDRERVVRFTGGDVPADCPEDHDANSRRA